MKKRQIPIIAALSLCAALVFAQPFPSTVPLAAREHQSRGALGGIAWSFHLKGKQYSTKLAHEQIATGPEWSTSSSLPLTLAKVEQIARVELRKLVGDDSTWEVTELSLKRLLEQTEARWYYLIKLMPKGRESNVISDSFVFPISFSGELGQVYGQ